MIPIFAAIFEPKEAVFTEQHIAHSFVILDLLPIFLK